MTRLQDAGPPPAPSALPASPAGASAAARWRRLPVTARIATVAAGLLIGFNLLLAGVDLATGGPPPAGPPSSSYATAPEGLAAYADLLAAYGHPVRRLRKTLDEAALDPRATVVVADPSPLTDAENRALRRFVRDGGRLVAAGADVESVLGHILGRGPEWAPAGTRSARPLAEVPEVSNVSVVRAAGRGSWSDAGDTLPVLGEDGVDDAGRQTSGTREGARAGSGEDQAAAGTLATVASTATGTLATVASAGAGRVIALADASPLQNDLLDEADNAAFGLAVAGERGRPVAFAEAAHGYADSEGLAAIPQRWRAAIAGALAATFVWMWSRGRRHGPPEDEERALPPPRRAYVDAMAASLAKTRDPARSAMPLQEAARRRIARRAGLPPDAGDDAVRQAAVHLGISSEEVAALFAVPRNDRDLLAVGRATATALATTKTRPTDQETRPW